MDGQSNDRRNGQHRPIIAWAVTARAKLLTSNGIYLQVYARVTVAVCLCLPACVCMCGRRTTNDVYARYQVVMYGVAIYRPKSVTNSFLMKLLVRRQYMRIISVIMHLSAVYKLQLQQNHEN